MREKGRRDLLLIISRCLLLIYGTLMLRGNNGGFIRALGGDARGIYALAVGVAYGFSCRRVLRSWVRMVTFSDT